MHIRAAGAVKRFHTVPTHGHQTVAEHSFYMCLIINKIADNPSANLFRAALFHDLPEHETGDVPATTKWQYPGIADELLTAELAFIGRHGLSVTLSEREWLTLKYADMAELVYYCIDQLNLGNKNMKEIAHRGIKFLNELRPLNSKADEMILDLCTKLKEFE